MQTFISPQEDILSITVNRDCFITTKTHGNGYIPNNQTHGTTTLNDQIFDIHITHTDDDTCILHIQNTHYITLKRIQPTSPPLPHPMLYCGDVNDNLGSVLYSHADNSISIHTFLVNDACKLRSSYTVHQKIPKNIINTLKKYGAAIQQKQYDLLTQTLADQFQILYPTIKDIIQNKTQLHTLTLQLFKYNYSTVECVACAKHHTQFQFAIVMEHSDNYNKISSIQEFVLDTQYKIKFLKIWIHPAAIDKNKHMSSKSSRTRRIIEKIHKKYTHHAPNPTHAHVIY